MGGGRGGQCGVGGEVGEWNALVVSMRLYPCYVVLHAKIENRNRNCEQGCKGESIMKKSSLSVRRGLPSHKRKRVYNEFKSEYLLLKQKVLIYNKMIWNH